MTDNEKFEALLEALDAGFDCPAGEKLNALGLLLLGGADYKNSAQRLAKEITTEAVVRDDTDMLRAVADILDGVKPRRVTRLLTPAQENIAFAVMQFYFGHDRFPDSALVEFSEARQMQKISKSMLTDFPMSLPIGRGIPGPRPSS